MSRQPHETAIMTLIIITAIVIIISIIAHTMDMTRARTHHVSRTTHATNSPIIPTMIRLDIIGIKK